MLPRLTKHSVTAFNTPTHHENERIKKYDFQQYFLSVCISSHNPLPVLYCAMEAEEFHAPSMQLDFDAWGEPVYVFLMLFSIIFNYLSGIEIDGYRENENTKMLRYSFWFTVVVNLAILGFFKYYGFLINNLNTILPFEIPYKELSLPIGISFYTFQTLSYIIDVYKGVVPVQKNFVSFGAYVTMFPQLIAGSYCPVHGCGRTA